MPLVVVATRDGSYAKQESVVQQLRARGAPSDPSQYQDPDQAASVLLAAGGPVDIRHDELVLLQ